mmetsp:Transcript_71080/g.205812  ORF Transcript_71080/g.205812 Transcript_71080/m.205812 type:complete len:240 (+) Transcript_71080:738-1457(+)
MDDGRLMAMQVAQRGAELEDHLIAVERAGARMVDELSEAHAFDELGDNRGCAAVCVQRRSDEACDVWMPHLADGPQLGAERPHELRPAALLRAHGLRGHRLAVKPCEDDDPETSGTEEAHGHGHLEVADCDPPVFLAAQGDDRIDRMLIEEDACAQTAEFAPRLGLGHHLRFRRRRLLIRQVTNGPAHRLRVHLLRRAVADPDDELLLGGARVCDEQVDVHGLANDPLERHRQALRDRG